MITAAVRAANRERERIGNPRRDCPICGSLHLEYEFLVDKAAVCGCQTCGLLFLNPAPEPSNEASPADSSPFDALHQSNAEDLLQELVAYSGIKHGHLLIIGENRYLEDVARARGFYTRSVSAEAFEAGENLPDRVDLCVLFSSLEKMRDPLSVMQSVRALLPSDGAAMVVGPTTDSKAARTFRSSWWEFTRQARFYFSTDTLQNLLARAGFGDSIIREDRQPTSVKHLLFLLDRRGERSRKRSLLRLLAAAPVLSTREFQGPSSRTRFLVRPKPLPRVPKLSVIVPVFNERATFPEMMDQLIAKCIDGVEIEIIVVESNSTDGTRELVQQYAAHPRVKLILQDKARGKGFAVRSGLQAATGEIVLFQDADLEYDLNDYESLLTPILRFETNFVLGSRHNGMGNSWKIRKFNDAAGLSALFNFGHLLFLTLFNTLYSQRLSDPFTMYKVFRRDCISGLAFECNRFDFDYEIVIKLLRKGYKPLELPVNYVSRSITEGKKVTVFKDPITWIRALLKFRKSPLYDDLAGSRNA